ncbi:hypothetical protein CERSUDRAFT_116948 [Gelatoporia subvermispora B]|uniref:RING-type domain-containing protein n=1 Tax=Ceriporiopsis subvermispora (strain B) TaxID=914234 RepID=M2QRD1_CERS8|nr:hypothetical protein CERSUDRAFT_116948 [Gelatoporia subvermispora B]
MSHKCPTCNRSFEQLNGWWNHATDKGHTFNWPFTCDVCKRPLKNAQSLLQHRAQEHPTEAKPKTSAGVQSPSTSATTSSTRSGFRCTECSLDFSSQILLEEHFKSSDNHPNCPRCRVGVRDSTVLNIHMQAVHPVVHCDVCNISLYREEKQKHDATHNKPILFGCTRCGRGYATEATLHEHYSDPAARHPMCVLCKVGFADDAARDEHMSQTHPPKPTVPSQVAGILRKEAPFFTPTSTQYGTQSISTSASSSHVEPKEDIAVAHAQPAGERHGSSTTAQAPAPNSPTEISMSNKSEPIQRRTLDPVSVPEPASESPDLTFLSSITVESLPDSFAEPPDGPTQPQSLTMPVAPAFSQDTGSGSTSAEVAASYNPDAKANTPTSDAKPSASGCPSVIYDLLTERASEAQEDTESTRASEDTPDGASAKDNHIRLVTKSAVTTRAPMTTSLLHCRICFEDPCQDPTATICGHIFCHECIVQELATNHQCPVCKSTMLVRLKF